MVKAYRQAAEVTSQLLYHRYGIEEGTMRLRECNREQQIAVACMSAQVRSVWHGLCFIVKGTGCNDWQCIFGTGGQYCPDALAHLAKLYGYRGPAKTHCTRIL